MKDSQKMEGRKAKRGKGKTTGGHARVAEKKKKTQVMNDKEEMDRLEAASVLSSLMFLPPKSTDGSDAKSPVSSESNGVASPTSSVTYISAAPTTGISTRGHQQGQLSQRGGSGAAKLITAPAVGAVSKPSAGTQSNKVIIAQLKNQVNYIIRNGQPQPIQLMTMHPQGHVGKPNSTTASKSHTSVPNIVMRAESPTLPVTLNAGRTVNSFVASALRQAVTSTNKKQTVLRQPSSAKTKVNEASKVSKKTDSQTTSSVAEDKATDLKKKDNSDNNLPLKKRRLIAVGTLIPNDAGTLDSKNEENAKVNAISSARLSDLTSAVQIENILQMAREYSGRREQGTNSTISCTTDMKPQEPGEGYKPVQIDPRTSLMILSDVKVALTPDQDGDLPIHIAVVHENLELVKKLIDIMAMSGKSVDRYNKLHQTPLHLAIYVDQPDIVAALLDAGANPNLVDRYGRTAPHIAIARQFPDCLQAVFEHSERKLRLDNRDYDGYPALHTCIDKNDLTSMEYLVQHGANVDVQDGKAGRSALFYATEYNLINIVCFLVSQGAAADTNNYAGVSPMMVAQSGNMNEMIGVLQKALDNMKTADDPQDIHTKKVPIPRIPSKSSLIVSSDQAFRSRSNSEDRRPSLDDRRSPAIFRKRAPSISTSTCSSPIDLSIAKTSKDLPKETHKGKLERSQSVNAAKKEKHTQLIAALESRNSGGEGSRTQAVNGNMRRSGPESSTQVVNKSSKRRKGQENTVPQGKQIYEKYIPAKSPEEVDLHVSSNQQEDESRVTSSSDILVDTTRVKCEKMDSEVQCESSDLASIISSESVEDMDTDKPAFSSQQTVRLADQGKDSDISVSGNDEATMGLPTMGLPMVASSMHDTCLSSSQEEVDTEGKGEISKSNSPSATANSPEMPVLSRMASFSNEQDSSSASVGEDVPEIEKEENASSGVGLKTSSKAPTQSSAPFDSQKSQESLQSSQGFDTVNVFSKKVENLESDMDTSQESSQKSDDSLEIENTALSSLAMETDSSKDTSDKDSKEVSYAKVENVCEQLSSVDDDQYEDMETDEEDEEKPLVIDEGPMEMTAKGKPAVSLLKVTKTSQNKVRLNSSDSKSSTGQDKGMTKDVQAVSSVKATESDKSDERTSNCVVSVADSKVTITDATSDDIGGKGSTDKAADSQSNEKTNKGKDRIDLDGVKPEVEVQSTSKADSDSTASDSLGSVDHLLKDGKSHTLYYHDGENYKPIKIFIDNSEQSSLVLQKMLQASFSNIPAKPTSNNDSHETQDKDTKSANKKVATVKPSRSIPTNETKSSDDSGKEETNTTNPKSYSDKDSADAIKKDTDKVSSSGKSDSAINKKPNTTPNTPTGSPVKRQGSIGGVVKATVLTEAAAAERAAASFSTSTNKSSFQPAYIEYLKKATQEANQKDITKAANVTIVDKNRLTGPKSKSEPLQSGQPTGPVGEKEASEKHLVPEKVTDGKLKVKSVSSVTCLSDRPIDKSNILRDQNKSVAVKASDKRVKQHGKQDFPTVASAKSSTSLVRDLTIASTSVAASSEAATDVNSMAKSLTSTSIPHVPSNSAHKGVTPLAPQRAFTPSPPTATVRNTGFQPGRTALSEGTLTRVNPDIKNRLSMALQSSQRKLGKPKAGLSCQEYEPKYPNIQGIMGNTSFEGVTSQSVTDTRQQL